MTRNSARRSAGKGGDPLLHCIANLARVAFRSADDRRAGAAEDELVRGCVQKVENHRAFGVLAHVGVSGWRAGPHAVGAVAVRPGSSVTSAVAPIGDGNEGGEFGGGGLHGDAFSLKLSRTPQITWQGGFLSDLGPLSNASAPGDRQGVKSESL